MSYHSLSFEILLQYAVSSLHSTDLGYRTIVNPPCIEDVDNPCDAHQAHKKNKSIVEVLCVDVV